MHRHFQKSTFRSGARKRRGQRFPNAVTVELPNKSSEGPKRSVPREHSLVHSLSKEFKPRGGSAPLACISLGFFAMRLRTHFRLSICVYLRLGGGDPTAIAGIVGLFHKALGGIFCQSRIPIGKSKEQSQSLHLIGPIFCRDFRFVLAFNLILIW